MWCPDCKNEYIAGVTHCKDCGAALVDVLEEKTSEKENAALLADNIPAGQKISYTQCEEENDADEKDSWKSEKASASYVSKRIKRKDMFSTAYAFTLVSVLGLVFLILFAAGVIPLNMTGSSKIMFGTVMGIMFVLFLFIGIRSFCQLKQLDAAADTEDALFTEITEWFYSVYSAASIDTGLDTNAPEEMLYFSRYDRMSQLLLAKYPNLESGFCDHIIETLYGEIFS